MATSLPHARNIETAPAFVGVLRLAHYLEVAMQRRVSLRLHLGVQSIDIGAIDVVAGELVHAEMPGANGDRALEMLVRLRRLEVRCGPLPDVVRRDVSPGWRSDETAIEPLTPAASAHVAAAFDEALGTAAPTSPAAAPLIAPTLVPPTVAPTSWLAPLRLLDGYVAAGVLDDATGGLDEADGDDVELAIAAAGMTDLVATMRELGGGEFEELAVTTSSRLHLLRTIAGDDGRVLLLVIDRSGTSLALAQHFLRSFDRGTT